MELLEFLYPKYPLHLITNGFDDIQGLKMEASGITGFFGEVITSHRAGEKKPHPQIFEYAMQTVGVTAHECIMIGDNWIADILGAKNIGIDTIWYNPHATPSTSGSATYEVRSLRDIPWDIF
jgi:putative hydrolase of the HAD superfamily